MLSIPHFLACANGWLFNYNRETYQSYSFFIECFLLEAKTIYAANGLSFCGYFTTKLRWISAIKHFKILITLYTRSLQKRFNNSIKRAVFLQLHNTIHSPKKKRQVLWWSELKWRVVWDWPRQKHTHTVRGYTVIKINMRHWFFIWDI